MEQKKPKESYVLSGNLVQLLIDYLVTRPYVEAQPYVDAIVSELKSTVNAQVPTLKSVPEAPSEEAKAV